jgi:thioredoxin reductase (NADPH)
VVTAVDFSSAPFKVTTETGKEFLAKTIIISTGASAKWLNVPGEQNLYGKGVSACATCDGFFFRGKDIVVVGGGDSAMEEANFLTRFANKVTVIHRSESFRASKIMLDRAKKNPKIEFLMDTLVEEVLGDNQIRALKIKSAKTGDVSEFATQGLFVAIGHKPNTEIFTDKITLDQKGYIVTEGKSTATNIPGVFACGDVMDPYYRQAVTAAGSGCQAALEAERYLAHQE